MSTIAERTVALSTANHIMSTNWESCQIPWLDFVAMMKNHEELAEKGGSVWSPAAYVGTERKKAAASVLSIVTLDIDSGDKLDAVVQRCRELGLEAVVASTHSHLTTKTKILFDDYARHVGGAPTPEGALKYLTEIKRYKKEALGDVSIVHACKQTVKGMFIVVGHDQLDKGRIAVLLKYDFGIVEQMAQFGLTHAQVQAKWGNMLEALARMLGVTLDPACKDLSRAFYASSHAPGADFLTTHIEGAPLDINMLDLKEQKKSARKEAPRSSGKAEVDPFYLKFAAKHGKTCQLADLISAEAPDKVRGKTTGVVGITVECPFDGQHSNAGDPHDRACFVMNASDSSSGQFVFKCQHGGCQGLDRLDMLQEAVAQGWIAKETLEHPASEQAGYDADGSSADDSCEEAQNLAELMSELSSLAEQRELFDTMACCEDKLVHSSIFKKLKAKRAMNMEDARKVLRERLRQKKMDAAKNGKRPYFVYLEEDFGAIVAGVAKVLEDANALKPRLFRMAGVIVRLSVDPVTGATALESVKSAVLRQEINQLVSFGVPADFDMKSISCPKDVADDLLNDQSLDLPLLQAVVDAPYFDAEGNIVYEAGYNPESYVWYQPCPGFVPRKVSLIPLLAEVEEAKALIADVIGEFPYCDGSPANRSSQAHGICFMLEGFVRRLIAGPTPIYLIQKPTPGTGATLFVNAVAQVNTGNAGIPQVELSSADEFRKNVTATLMNGVGLYWIDNVHNKVDSPSLALATTSEFWRDRVLQKSKTVVLPVSCTWCVSGNNVELSEELARRSILIRFDANVERPTERDGFRHLDLIGHIRSTRADLVWACLTLVQAWIRDGKPLGTTLLASYERWSQVMGGILQTVGIDGLLENREELREVASDDLGAVKAFVDAWWHEFGDRQVPVTVTGSSPSEGCKSLLDLYHLHADKLDLGFNGARFEAWPSALGKCVSKVSNRVFEIDAGAEVKLRVKVRSQRKTGGAVKWLERL